MANPTATSTAATAITINTKDLAGERIELAGKGDECQIDGVHHNLDAHQHDQHIARMRTPPRR